MSKSQSSKAIVTEIDSLISLMESSLDSSPNSNPKQQSNNSNDDEKKYDQHDLNQGRMAGTSPNICLEEKYICTLHASIQ